MNIPLDTPIPVKFVSYTKKGTRIYVPGEILVTKTRIEFLKSPFSLKDDIKAMRGSRWLGYDDPPRTVWTVENCKRNWHSLSIMLDGNPYEWFDRPLETFEYARPLMTHQEDLSNNGLTYHFQIWGAEMGVGKSLSAIELIEKSGVKTWWWVGPRSGLYAVEREFIKWGISDDVTLEVMTYEGLTKRMKNWVPGTIPPQGIIFDESSRLKSPTSQRSQAAQALTDGMRDHYGNDAYVILMSGTPAPRSPLDWWKQCLSKDTWILTSKGPKQISQLIDKPCGILVNDNIYETDGFYSTGVQTLYEISTKEGYTLKATKDHKLQKSDNTWTRVDDLKPDDTLKRPNYKDKAWEGWGSFGDGYLLGLLFGDGNVYTTSGNWYGRLSFYETDFHLIDIVKQYIPTAVNICGTRPKHIFNKYISKLIRHFSFDSKKIITSEFESTVSSECMKGFIRGFFDADASVEKSRLRIGFAQTDKNRIYTVQRMLTYFGIYSKMQVRKAPDKPSYIEGREIFPKDTWYVLHITNDDAVAFYERIGFHHQDKQHVLEQRIQNRHTWKTKHFLTVDKITKGVEEEVYDTTVPGPQCFTANGFIAHNCEICYPGFLKEGSYNAFKIRMGICRKQTNSLTGQTFLQHVTWRDDERKCDTCGGYDTRIPITELLGPGQSSDEIVYCDGEGHKFTPSKNEVSYLYERLNGLAVIKHKEDCLDLPDKRYRLIRCESNPALNRVAKSLLEAAPSTVTGLTWLRELSDGFQYRNKVVGTQACRVCEGSCKTDYWVDPEDDERAFTMTDMLDPEYVSTLIKETRPCATCNGTGEIPKYERTVKEIPCPKDEALVDLLDENEEQGRVVIFAGFTGSIDKITALCLKQKWAVVRVDGRGWLTYDAQGNQLSVKPLDYWADVENNTRVAFVAHPKSGGMGLTLTEARMAIYYSNSYEGESRTQSEDRIHRIGCDENIGVEIVDIINLPTDEAVLARLKENRRLELMTMTELTEVL